MELGTLDVNIWISVLQSTNDVPQITIWILILFQYKL